MQPSGYHERWAKRSLGQALSSTKATPEGGLLLQLMFLAATTQNCCRGTPSLWRSAKVYHTSNLERPRVATLMATMKTTTANGEVLMIQRNSLVILMSNHAEGVPQDVHQRVSNAEFFGPSFLEAD